MAFSAANAETGATADLEKLSLLAEKYRIPLLIDGVALLGKKNFSFLPGISAMAFSAHKIHGPKGAGFLILRRHLPCHAQISGGPQEYQKRAGTENLSGILGMAEAVAIALKNQDRKIKKMQFLRDLFEAELQAQLTIQINGPQNRLCNLSNLAFEGILAEDLLIRLDQKAVFASHGSACSAKAFKVSRVLLNMGYEPKRAASSIRFSLSKLTTKTEILKAVKIIVQLCRKLKAG
jgi:cysteine desulfurase